MYHRIIITICLSLLIIGRSIAQGDPNQTLQQQKLTKYKNMKQGGLALIVIGGILVVTGTAIEVHRAGESWNSMWTGEPEPEDNNISTVLFYSGTVLAGAGIPLAIVGSNKYKYYKRNSDVISLGIKTHPQSTGLRLTYRF
jgi:hypothetical protein